MFYVIPRVRELLSLQLASSIRFSPGIAATHTGSGDTCFQTIIITILTIIFTCERDYILEIYVLLMVYYLDQVALIYHALKSEKKLTKTKITIKRPAVE